MSDDLRRAGDGREPVRFLNDKFVVDELDHGRPSWVTLLLAALAAVVVLVFLLAGALAWITPETFTPSKLFCW